MSLPDLPHLFWRHRIYPNAIVHIGANVGEERDNYSKYCDGEVTWIEATPKIYNRLVENIAKYPKQRALLACISDTDGEERSFHVAGNGGQSSSLLPLGSHRHQHPDVKFIGDIPVVTTRVDSLFARELITLPYHCYGAIDIQGAELLALRSIGTLLPRFDWLYCEVNRGETYVGCALVDELDAYLAFHGFERRETWWWKPDSSWGDAIFCRRSP